MGFPGHKMAHIALDATDREILIALQANARLPNNDLAAAVGLSPSPCLRRVRRLEKLGVITGYSALLNRTRVGVGLTAFVSVDIERNRKAETDLLRSQIQALPEVVAAHIVTGDSDFLLEVATANLETFSQFVLGVLNKLPGVKGVRSNISLDVVKHAGALPIPALEQSAS
jgi:Lrp/AsnC family transcriptional regulator, leucine-responsive regulatory protein